MKAIPYKKCPACESFASGPWKQKRLTYSYVFIDSQDKKKYLFKVKPFECGSYMTVLIRSGIYTLIKRCPKSSYEEKNQRWDDFKKELDA